jgi:hypothetical protein
MDRHSKLTAHPSASLTARCSSTPAIAWEFVALPYLRQKGPAYNRLLIRRSWVRSPPALTYSLTHSLIGTVARGLFDVAVKAAMSARLGNAPGRVFTPLVGGPGH